MKRLLFLVLVILMATKLSAQPDAVPDSTRAGSILPQASFSTSDALDYLDHVVKTNSLWRSQDDPLRKAFQRLLDHSTEHFDSTLTRLQLVDMSQIEIIKGDTLITDSIDLRWLNDSTFLVDPHGWSPDLYLKKEARLFYPEGIRQDLFKRTSDSTALSESARQIPDTLFISLIDTAAIESLGIQMHTLHARQIVPPLQKDSLPGYISTDRSRVYYYLPGITWEASGDSPFNIVENESQLDSLQLALDRLLTYISERDSMLVWINDINGNRKPFWLSGGHDESYRFWVKNYNNDSITLWIGNPAPDQISLLLEDDVSINRLKKEEIRYLPEFVEIPERELAPLKLLEPEPIYWDFGFKSAFTLNQTYLSNWTKGGESSLSGLIDLHGESTYNNKQAKTQWISSMRLNFGTIKTKENGFRKNQDMIELNSKYNRNAWGKIGASASLYMKTQLAKGYNYPNDSVEISKFLSPATLTLGLGFEYKPVKNTSVNIAPLSYRNTFVLDTTDIDQTIQGIEEGKRSKQEMGAQVVLISKVNPFKDLTVVNNLRLFSNYLDKPQNVDVDWEITMDQKINWFFTIRLDLHLIYDNDIRFPVYDSEGNPVLNPDGSGYTVAKAQFKEFIGLSLQFNF